MKIGKLKWFNDKKGFGFITNDEGKDVFVHYSQIRYDGFKTLKDGDILEYEEINTAKGLQAKNVVVIDHMEQEGEEKEAMTQQ